MPVDRGQLNNNPGNLVKTRTLWKGEKPVSSDPTFKQFYRLEDGIAALIRNLIYHLKHGKDTIQKLMDVYDPPPDDNSQYIAFLSKRLDKGKNEKLTGSKDELLKLTRFIINFEGRNTITDKEIENAYNNMGLSSPTKQKNSWKGADALLFGLSFATGYLIMENYE